MKQSLQLERQSLFFGLFIKPEHSLSAIAQQVGECRVTSSCRVHSDSFKNGRLADPVLAGEECHPSETRDQEVLYPSKALNAQVGEMEVGIDWICCGHGTADLVLRMSQCG